MNTSPDKRRSLLGATAVAVLLAVATLFIAGLAIWGYTAIREAAEAKAESAAREIATNTAQLVATREIARAFRLWSASRGGAGDPDVEDLTKELTDGDGENGGGARTES